MKFDVAMNDLLWSEKIRRDLNSILCDPLLLDLPEASRLQEFMRTSVHRFVQRYPHRLEEMIARPEPRLPLGKWFERVFLAALRMSFPFADVKHSVPDGCGGELDFVIRDGRSVVHIECAVKFFLSQPSIAASLNSFIGPGGQDRLDLKYHKMRDIQLRRVIPNMTSGDQVTRVLWMSGCIMLPLGHGEVNVSAFPAPMNRKLNCCGTWSSYEEFSRVSGEAQLLLALPRAWWITPLAGLTSLQLEGFPAFSPDYLKDGPVMVAALGFEHGQAIEKRILLTKISKSDIATSRELLVSSASQSPK